MIEHIPELVASGINSFKIEGRMKSAYYVASVVKAYREAMDEYFKDPEKYTFNSKWMDYLVKPSHRRYFTGFYFGEDNKQYTESSAYIRDYDIIGIVEEYNNEEKRAIIKQRNKAFEGDKIEILKPKGDNIVTELFDIRDKKNEKIESTPVAQMIYSIATEYVLEKGDMLIKSKQEEK